LEIDGEGFEVNSGSFVTFDVKLFFSSEVFNFGVLILVPFDVLKCQGYGEMLDCLVDFVGKIVVIGDCACWVRNTVGLHFGNLLYQTIVVAEAGYGWRLIRRNESCRIYVVLEECDGC